MSVVFLFFVLWGLSMLRCYRYLYIPRMVAQAKAEPLPEPSSLPPLSVIVVAHEQCDTLRQHLPSILEQDYPRGFEVIVVDMNSKDDTADYLESLAKRYPHLHISRTPDSARNVSPIRLALTLGIRAASHDWVVLTQADCKPVSSHWLTRLGQQCMREGKQVVGGNTITDHFLTNWRQLFYLPYANRHGAYTTTGTNLCYRRSLFLSHRGFADDTHLLTGAVEIMVNHYSNRSNTTICLHPDAFVRQDRPAYTGRWRRDQLFFMEAQSHFHRKLMRMAWIAEILTLWVVTLSFVVAIGSEIQLFHRPRMAAGIGLFALFYYIWYAFCVHRAFRALHLPASILFLPFLLHTAAIADILGWLRWCFTRKRTFHKRFI